MMKMNKDLAALVAAAKEISDDALAEAALTDEVNMFAEKTLSLMIDANLLSASIPLHLEGINLGLETGTHLALLQILKYIGSGNLVMGRVLEGHINAQLLIHQFGTAAQKECYAKKALEGNLFGVWNTQANDGTFLTPQNDGTYFLNGSKTFATGTDYVSLPIVTAALPYGSWQMIVVPLKKVTAISDASWWNPMGMRSSRSYKMTFDNAVIQSADLLGKAGDYYLQPAFSGGAVRFAAIQLGAAERLLKETILYLQDLKRTEDPFQKMRIGEMTIAVASGNQWIQSAANEMDLYMQNPTSENQERFLAFTNMMRTAIEKICTEVMERCQKCVGARGLNKPYHFERIIRDLNTYLRQPAPDMALTEVGKYVLDSENQLWENNTDY